MDLRRCSFLGSSQGSTHLSEIFKRAPLQERRAQGSFRTSIGEAYSAILQNRSPSKRQDPGSFSIPCCIGDLQIERAFCDLGAGVSLMPLSLCKKLQLLDLLPTTMIIQLADRSVKRPVGILEDIPIQVGKFVIPYDFIVMNMDENPEVPIILGRPFLATAEAVIDVQASTMSFQVCGEKIDFHFSPHIMPVVPALCRFSAVSPGVMVDNGGGGPHMSCIELADHPPPVLTGSVGTAGRTKK